MDRRQLLMGLAAAPLVGLVACSGPYNVSASVVSFGEWPADRAPGKFAFERLPSQKVGAAAQSQDKLEAMANSSLERAGFVQVAEGTLPDVIVTLGVRLSLNEPAIWDDPLWWHWRGPYRRGAWYPGPIGRPGPFDPYYDRRFSREAAILIRDRASGTTIYEAHASNDGISAGDDELVEALFLAALHEFPKANPKPHDVVVQMAGQPVQPAAKP